MNPVSLPILVAFPVAPSWLVARYLVTTGYKIGSDFFSGGDGQFDYKGGLFKGAIVPNAHGDWPATVTITTTVEYTPDSGLANLTKTDTPAAAAASVTVQLPNRRMTNISIFLEFPHGVLDGDFLTFRWAYLLGAESKTQGSLFLDYDALLPGLPRPAKPVTLGFIQDPAPTASERFHLEIAGRIFKTDLTFKDDLTLPLSLIVAKVKDDAAPGTGIHVELS